MEASNAYYYFKLDSQEKSKATPAGGPQNFKIIGILDNSGSMSGAWTAMVRGWNKLVEENLQNVVSIVFSNNASIVDGPVKERLSDYEGGGTNMQSAYEMLHIYLEGNPQLKNVVIIFVSDGGDNDPKTLKNRLKHLFIPDRDLNISFICLGVGRGFPTFMAMDFREKYHRGDAGIPPVFLIENTSQQEEYEQNFAEIRPYLGTYAKFKLSKAEGCTPMKEFPWGDNAEEAYEHTWMLSNEPKPTLFGEVLASKREDELSVTDTEEIFKKWVSKLQLTSLKENVMDRAKIALEIMKRIMAALEKNEKKATSGEMKSETPKKLSFHDRLMKKYARGKVEELNIFVKEVKLLSEENILNKLSEAEAAKRLAIGTKMGRYHQKAMELRGLTVADYENARNKFIDLLKNNKLDGAKPSSQEPSVIILQNQKDVICETNLVEGLKICPSQYDLTENFPLVGHALKLYRFDGSMINPYLVQVNSIAKHHKVVDSVSIQQKNNELHLSLGSEEEEVVNCVLPLFKKDDAELKPFINSQLFHILMTFNVMQNADTLYYDAYLALIASTAVHVLSVPTESEWKTEMLELIYDTMNLTYMNHDNFKKYVQAVLDNPDHAVVTENPSITTKCEDLSKTLLALFMLHRDKKADPAKVEAIMNAMIREFFGRSWKADQKFQSLYQVKNKEELDKLDLTAILEKINEKYKDNAVEKFQHMQVYRQTLERELNEVKFDEDVGKVIIEWQSKSFDRENSKYSIRNWNHLFKYFTGKDFPQANYELFAYHASKFTNSYERNTNPMETDVEKIHAAIRKEVFRDMIISRKEKALEEFWKAVEQKYRKEFTDLHNDVHIITEQDLKEHCEKNKIDFALYRFNPVTLMVGRACLAPKCPYYLKHDESLNIHYIANNHIYHALEKAVASLYMKTPEDVWEAVVTGACLDKAKPLPPPLTVECLARKDEALKEIALRMERYAKAVGSQMK